MTRYRRAPLWRRLIQRPAPVEDAVTEPVEIAQGLLVTEPGEFYRDADALFGGVAATRARVENRHAQEAERKRREAEAHRRQHGSYLSPAAVVPAPPMPGGAR